MVTGDHSIPSDPDSFMSYYHSSRNVKRDRDAESIESRQSKVHRRSTSHSAAPSLGQSVPSTKVSTHAVSRMSHDGSVSPVDESDLHGASRTTGGVFRGRAIGNVLNWADVGMYYFLYMVFFSMFSFSPFLIQILWM